MRHPEGIAFCVAPLDHTAGMSFGQPSGPPASASQVQQLLTLLHEAGHTDFRDARGPMGFTQRQAGGKFTRTEAEAFIAQLEAEQESGAGAPPSPPAAPASPAPTRSHATVRGSTPSMEQLVRSVPTTVLAAELQRRGWVVLEP